MATYIFRGQTGGDADVAVEIDGETYRVDSEVEISQAEAERLGTFGLIFEKKSGKSSSSSESGSSSSSASSSSSSSES